MSTTKRGPSLYEVLKEALRRQEQERRRLGAAAPEPAAGSPPQETPAAEPAAEPEAAPPIEASAPPTAEAPADPPADAPPAPEACAQEAPAPASIDPAEPCGPAVAAEPAPPEPVGARGVGERTLAMTYNTAAFVALVLVAAIFAAYSAGLNRGRRDLEQSEEPAPAPAASIPPSGLLPPPPPPPPPAAEFWRIKAYAWEKDPRNDATRVLRKQLERGGFPDLWTEEMTLANGKQVVVLYCGRFARKDAPEALAVAERLRRVVYDRRALEPHVAFVRFRAADAATENR
jgi:hypothetical protein